MNQQIIVFARFGDDKYRIVKNDGDLLDYNERKEISNSLNTFLENISLRLVGGIPELIRVLPVSKDSTNGFIYSIYVDNLHHKTGCYVDFINVTESKDKMESYTLEVCKDHHDFGLEPHKYRIQFYHHKEAKTFGFEIKYKVGKI